MYYYLKIHQDILPPWELFLPQVICKLILAAPVAPGWGLKYFHKFGSQITPQVN